MFNTKFAEKIKTHILCSVTFPPKNRAIYDNVAKYGRSGQTTDDNVIWRMRIACWTPKVTDTNSEYVILVAFPQ
jgi:hypothetical protein